MNIPHRHFAAFSVSEIASITGGTLLRDGPDVRGIAAYPQDVEPGCGYVALGATPYDYARRVAESALAGASAFVIERAMSCPPGCGVVLVRSAATALADLARAHRRRWGRSVHARGARAVISITGTAGKSSTRRLVAALLGMVDDAPVVETGDALDRVGVALTLLRLADMHRFAVVETATRYRGDVARLAQVTDPDVGVLTLVGFAHAEGVGTFEDLASEKGDLFAAVHADGLVAFNADDRNAAAQVSRAAASRRVSWGFSAGADYRIVSRAPLGLDGSRIRVARPQGPELAVVTKSFGVAGALTVAAAVAIVEKTIGTTLKDTLVQDAVRFADDSRETRLSATTLPDETIVLADGSDASPSSIRACLEAAGEIASALTRRLVVVLGELHELGQDAAREHAALGSAVAQRRPAVLIAIGHHARNAAVEALSLGVDTFAVTDPTSAIPRVLSTVYSGDVVLVAGGRASGLSSVTQALVARSLEPRTSNGGARTLQTRAL